MEFIANLEEYQQSARLARVWLAPRPMRRPRRGAMIVKATEQDDGPSARPVVLFRMNSDQFAALPESKQYLELLNGFVVMSPKPRPRHQKFVGRLIAVLNPWTEQRNLGDLFPETEMRISDDWTPAPDLSFVRTEHGRALSGVRLSCSDSTIGNASTAPGT